MKTKSQQLIYFLAFFVTVLLLAASNFLQIYRGINPCPLCILQRMTLGLLSLIFLVGVTHPFKKWGTLGLGIVSLLISSLGIFFAGRQVWVQLFPGMQGGNCEVSLQYMLAALPLDQVAKKIFAGSAACSQVGWEFLRLSLAQWSLICFVLFLLFALWQLCRNQNK